MPTQEKKEVQDVKEIEIINQDTNQEGEEKLTEVSSKKGGEETSAKKKKTNNNKQPKTHETVAHTVKETPTQSATLKEDKDKHIDTQDIKKWKILRYTNYILSFTIQALQKKRK